MNIRTLTQISIALVLLVLLITLFIHGRPTSSDAHARVLQDISLINQANASLNQNILLTRSGLLNHYDSVNADINHAREAALHLRVSMLSVLLNVSPALEESYQHLINALSAKEELVEKFKTNNSLVQNSLMYFSLGSVRSIEEANLVESEYSGELIGRLSSYTLKFIRNPSSDSEQEYKTFLQRLSLDLTSTGNQSLKVLLKHSDLILQRLPVLTEILDSILQSGVKSSANDLLGKYIDEYRQQEAMAEQYRIASFLLSIIIAVYMIFLFVRYKASVATIAQSNKALSAEKKRAETTLKSIADGVITTDGNARIQYMNPVAERLTGWTADAAQGMQLMDVFHLVNQRIGTLAPDPIQLCMERDRVISWGKDHALISRDMQERIVHLSAAPMLSEESHISGGVLVFSDVSETHDLIERISHQASHDSLTGLVNRGEFEIRLEAAIIKARQDRRQHALCYLDLDQFKVVNDTCGHSAGDQLLKQLAQLLFSGIRQSDTLARLGGDEFGVLLNDCDLEGAEKIAKQLHGMVQDYRFVWRDRMFDVGVSIGVVSITDTTGDSAQLLSQVDMACYAAKDLGRNRIHIYRHGDTELLRRESELHWASRISKALDEDRLCLYCQEIRSIKEDDNSAQSKYEILVRLIGEDGQDVMPGAFIPAAERYNLMDSVDKWVIDNSLKVLGSLKIQGSIQFSINLSGNSISNRSLLPFIKEQLALYGVDAKQVCFEITETAAIINLSHAIELIESLREIGCQFSLDDFGAGLSSFSYLKTLPVDYVKIDGSFVRDMIEDPIDRAMVEAINQVGHIMGKRTIAEFVENDEILESLREIGVDYVQGYGVGKPKPIKNLSELTSSVHRRAV